MRDDLYVVEPGASEQPGKRLRIGKLQRVVTLRDVTWRRQRQLGDRLAEQALYPLPHRLIPPTESEHAAGRQNPHAFGQRRFGLGKMAEAEIAYHRVELPVRERQCNYVCHPELGSEMCPLCQRNHAR